MPVLPVLPSGDIFLPAGCRFLCNDRRLLELRRSCWKTFFLQVLSAQLPVPGFLLLIVQTPSAL